ncbi:MAG: sigma-70 family RNA polymerase sigma factor [Pseudomonadota bacterium]
MNETGAPSNTVKPVTRILHDWRSGDAKALDRLLPIVHDTLHGLAKQFMRSERSGHTLQATGLVNEAYLRLIDARVDWQSRAHFMAVAAQTMRRILIDHAKSRRRQKRGGELMQVTLNDDVLSNDEMPDSLLVLESTLERLTALDERKAKVIELSLFGGLTADEIGEVLEISRSTVVRELRFAKAWLQRELGEVVNG